ncbi:MAG TPA: carboxypeptidase regulatory-like domain-containing protein [Longimicrobium sp.]|nr:carboxypeptidase regulatory-like domain-containing protein [Longimicrobium sp.]
MTRYSAWRALAIAGLVLGAAAACERVATDPGAGGSANLSAPGSGSIGGKVVALDGSPIAGAVVSIPGGPSAVTGANGSFSIGGLAPAGRLGVDVSATGFAPTARIYAVVAGQTLSRDIGLIPQGAPVALVAGQGGEVRFSDGGLIEVPANAFEGVSPQEPIFVRVSYFDPADAASFRQAPGDFSGIEADGSASVLESNGMWSVSVTNARGTELNLREGQALRSSLPSRQARLAGGGTGPVGPEPVEEWGLYVWDTSRPGWVFVSSTSETAQRTFTQSGRNYNIDRRTSSSAMTVRAFDALGNPLPNRSITVSAVSYFGGAEAWTDANGFATLQLGASQQVSVLSGTGPVAVTTAPVGGSGPVTSLVF